jgi:hypothetical protein
MGERLKPCPFCGSAGEARVHEEIPTMHIAGCGDPDCIAWSVAYDFATEEAAVTAWNNRSSPPRPADSGQNHDWAFDSRSSIWSCARCGRGRMSSVINSPCAALEAPDHG